MGRLEGKVALITGASKGLGEADARLFKTEGATVILADVDVTAGQAIATEIDATFMSLDVTDEHNWTTVVDAIKHQFGRLDILINNAGIVEVGNILSTSTDVWRRVNAVSADGSFFGCRASIPLMIESGGGSVINMASIASMQGEHYVTAYCAAKGAVEAMTRAIACWAVQENNGIRCNSIHPSGMDTPMVASMGQKMAEANMGPAVPSGDSPRATRSKLGDAIDIAYMALYLASDESRFVNGAAMRVDNTMTVTAGVVPDFG